MLTYLQDECIEVWFQVDPDDDQFYASNPPVRFRGETTPNIVVDMPDGSFQVPNQVDDEGVVQDVLLLTKDLDNAGCLALDKFQDFNGPVFGRNGELQLRICFKKHC